MEWLFIIAFVIGAWWLGTRSGKSDAKVAPRPTQPAPSSFDDYQHELERKPIAELDGDELEIRRAREIFERQSKERTASYRAKKDAIATDEKKLERAEEFIKTSCLDVALPYVREEVQHWASWSKLDEGRWTAPMTLSDVDGSAISYDNNWVQFRPEGGTLFKVAFETSGSVSDEDLEFAEIKLFAEEMEVLSMGISRNYSNEWNRWRFVSVTSLRVGPWISEFVEFYGKLRAIQEDDLEDTMNEYVTSRAANVDLGTA